MLTYLKYQLISLLFGFVYTGFNLAIVWGVYEKNKDLKSVLWLFAGATLFRAIVALLSGFFVDRHSSKRIIQVAIFIMLLVSLVNTFGKITFVLEIASLLFMQIGQELFHKSYITFVSSEMASESYIKFDGVGQTLSALVSVFGSIVISATLTFISIRATLWVLTGILLCLFLLSTLFFKNDEQLKVTVQRRMTTSICEILSTRYILEFMVILFILNLSYGYIPDIMPYFLTNKIRVLSPLLIGFLQSGVNLGGIFASAVIVRWSQKVSALTSLGLVGCALIFLLLPLTAQEPLITVIGFSIYGFFDSLTQPFFSYFVSKIPRQQKGQTLGVVDFIVFFASTLGLFLGSYFSKFGMSVVSFYLLSVFVCAFVVLKLSKNYRSVTLNQSPDKE